MLVKEAVDDVDRQKEGLRSQSKSHVHLADPIDQDSSHFLVYIDLVKHVVLRCPMFVLCSA